MKVERSNVDFPMWRKKVDASLLRKNQTPIPAWICQIWNIEDQFEDCDSKSHPEAKVQICFNDALFRGWVSKKKKSSGKHQFFLSFNDELAYHLKHRYRMSLIRDIESRLKKNSKRDIEREIPFWEFLDIEYFDLKKTFFFTAYYFQEPMFPELFKHLISSPVMKKIDYETNSKSIKDRIYKQEWKMREKFETELGAKNVIYQLLDQENKLIYVGETKDLIRRFNQGHTEIKNWQYYRYNVLPKSLEKFRVTIERMIIRDYASILLNDKNIGKFNISDYKLANKKIDY